MQASPVHGLQCRQLALQRTCKEVIMGLPAPLRQSTPSPLMVLPAGTPSKPYTSPLSCEEEPTRLAQSVGVREAKQKELQRGCTGVTFCRGRPSRASSNVSVAVSMTNRCSGRGAPAACSAERTLSVVARQRVSSTSGTRAPSSQASTAGVRPANHATKAASGVKINYSASSLDNAS